MINPPWKIILNEVCRIIGECVGEYEKVYCTQEIRYYNKRLTYDIKGGDVVIEILVGFHERAETVAGPIFFDMSDPDLFENIEKFLKDETNKEKTRGHPTL